MIEPCECARVLGLCVERARECVLAIPDKAASGLTEKRTNRAKRRLGEYGEFGSWPLFGSW